MQRKDNVDIIIIIGPDNPGENTTQKFIQEKLEERIAHFKQQGLSCKVIGNGKDPVSADDMANLPEAQCVMICGHGTAIQETHRIELFKNPPDTNSLIENIQAKTGAKQFILASCYSGKANEIFMDRKNSIKDGTEIIALSPPDASTSMYFALDSVLQAVNEFGTNKQDNKANDHSKIYADLLQSSPNAMSYGVQAGKNYAMYDFDPKSLMYFSKDSDFIADSRDDGAAYFKNFLEENNRPPLPDQPASNISSINEYSRKLLDDFIYRGDVDSMSKIIEKCPMVMSRASINARDYSHQMDSMRGWANDDRKYMGMLKLLVNYDLDHCQAANTRGLFLDMNTNALPPANKLALKYALFELAIETNDSNKRNYFIQSLVYAEGGRLFDGIDQTRADLLRSRMSPEQLAYIQQEALKRETMQGGGNSSSAKVLSTLGSTNPDTPAKNKSASEEQKSNVSKAESSVAAPKVIEPEKEKQEEQSNKDNESHSNFGMRK